MSGYDGRSNYILAAISLLIIAVVVGVFYYFFVIYKIPLTEDTILAIINGVATTALALVALLNMRENRKVRSEMVRPHLSLEPTFFEYDKNGQIVGFNCLNLVNGGVVARDVDIDVSIKDKVTALYTSSIGISERVQIWTGQSEELGGKIVVSIKYKNLFNKSLQEVLSIDMDSINKSQKKFAPIHKA